MEVDSPRKTKDNNNNFLFIGNNEETIKINRRDIKFTKLGGHTHHYKPDFTDEWDEAIALVCVQCSHGRMHPKKDKKFMDWLDEHRA